MNAVKITFTEEFIPFFTPSKIYFYSIR